MSTPTACSARAGVGGDEPAQGVPGETTGHAETKVGCISTAGQMSVKRDGGSWVNESREARLILLCGLPGSGKTTVAKRLARDVPAVRLCPDEWMADLGIDLFDRRGRDRLERRFWLHAGDLLRLGQTVILEFGFWARSERDEKRLAARALGVPVELRYLEVATDELRHRLDARNERGEPGSVPITREMLEEYAKVFEAPTADELALFDEPPPGRWW